MKNDDIEKNLRASLKLVKECEKKQKDMMNKLVIFYAFSTIASILGFIFIILDLIN